MNASIDKLIKNRSALYSMNSLVFIGTFLVIILTSWDIMADYLVWSSEFSFSLLLGTFILFFELPINNKSNRGLLSIVFLVLYFFLPLSTIFYFGLMFFILFLLEVNIGRMNKEFILLLVINSPIFSYALRIFGFPIRLKLAEIVVKILSLFNLDAKGFGNVINIEGVDYEVESACSGIKMMVTGLALCLAISSLYRKQNKYCLSWWQLTQMMMITVFFVLISNVLRILLLVIFKIGEESFAHELVGLLCLIFYILLPLYFIVPRYLNWKCIVHQFEKHSDKAYNSIKLYIQMIVIISLLIFISLTYLDKSSFADEVKNTNSIVIEGFEKQYVKYGGLKFINEHGLVYVKPPKSYWAADHNPAICWRGSGYKLKHEKIEIINGTQIFTAQLILESDILYTAWWFENKYDKTISQLDWRYNMLNGAEPYNLINATASSKLELLALIHEIDDCLVLD